MRRHQVILGVACALFIALTFSACSAEQLASLFPWRFTVTGAGKFVYVANHGTANVSGYTINASTGALTAISGSPFSSGVV